ncbi:hypothetical protein I7I53_06444 [Histoplasma capsulatum var. duboisii H88]|uniref:Uncharacterized protein n=1 Tax=Ajellomyces capsulatus (strain H88) TaxID=544711 RepID=A0A8A1LBT9_AJEC8|nr:hypothetical protein I7I53_06444 [Histoplasma capsulatum var. duboisii H88]
MNAWSGVEERFLPFLLSPTKPRSKISKSSPPHTNPPNSHGHRERKPPRAHVGERSGGRLAVHNLWLPWNRWVQYGVCILIPHARVRHGAKSSGPLALEFSL